MAKKTSKEIRKEIKKLNKEYASEMQKSREMHQTSIAGLRSQLKDALKEGR